MPKNNQTKEDQKFQTQATEQTQNKSSSSPHDKFFKVIYSSPENALDIFKIIFPKTAFNKCNWKKLKAEKETFTDKQADLVFSVPLKRKPKSKIKIFILLEHKSYYNKDLFRQILDYQNSIYQGDTSGDIISVVPILFYHGRKPWTWKISFKEGYSGKYFSDIPVFFRENMLNYNLVLFDTNNPKIGRFFKDKRIKSRGALSALGRIWSIRKTVPELLELVALFSGFPEKKKKDLVIGLLYYLNGARGIGFNILNKVEGKAVQEGLLKKGGYMNFTEEIKKEARQKGRMEGRIEGRKEVVLNMLQKKADISFISEVTGLSEKEINKLKNSL